MKGNSKYVSLCELNGNEMKCVQQTVFKDLFHGMTFAITRFLLTLLRLSPATGILSRITSRHIVGNCVHSKETLRIWTGLILDANWFQVMKQRQKNFPKSFVHDPVHSRLSWGARGRRISCRLGARGASAGPARWCLGPSAGILQESASLAVSLRRSPFFKSSFGLPPFSLMLMWALDCVFINIRRRELRGGPARGEYAKQFLPVSELFRMYVSHSRVVSFIQ